MKKYRKKPLVIEAVQFTGGNGAEVSAFMETTTITKGGALVIETLEGDMRAHVGDYIIKGIKGEFYPCKPDIFKSTYEEVPE